jgi:pyruvate dehydrogenase E2 component (dihydrolipoamide acetyltransferase)
MAVQITIPRLGWSMEEGTFAGWRKADGDVVRRGDVLFELEGEKALQEIEAVDEGTLRIPADAPAVGAVLKVGAVIGWLTAAGESWPPAVSGAASGVDQQKPESPALEKNAAEAAHGEGSSGSPAVRRLARQLKVDLQLVQGTGRGGRVTDEDVRLAAAAETPLTVAGDTGAIRSTPRARRAASRHGVDLSGIRGTGSGGRIREKDVLAVAAAATGTRSVAVGSSGQVLKGRRAVIARRMRESRDNTVPVTITRTLNADNLVGLRDQFRSAGSDIVPAFHDLIARLTAECLLKHPLLGARWVGADVVLPDLQQICLGLAVDTADGLVVPALPNVRGKTVLQLARDSRDAIQRAREGRLSAADQTAAVFTISSLGGLGIDHFTPVINYPETAILGVGVIRRVPVVAADDRIIAGQQLTLSLTFDHQVIDGAPAARFLQDLVQLLENPAAALLSANS